MVVVRPLPSKLNGETLTWAPKGGLRKQADDSTLLNHHDILYRIGGYEPDRGVACAGHRAYYLTGPGVLLNQALIAYGLKFLTRMTPEGKRYTAVQPPYFMNKSAMSLVAQLEEYDEALYHVTGEGVSDSKYLIATSEQPICLYHANEDLQPNVCNRRKCSHPSSYVSQPNCRLHCPNP